MKARCHTVGLAEPGYPRRLRRLVDPPEQLHVWGRLDPDARMVAIVGTRGARRESTELAHELAASVARAGVIVVSGGAVGVDAAAHRGALEAAGTTVVILGSSLDQLYPQRNVALFHRVAGQGAVVSNFPPGTPPRRWQFPVRNRLVAALCEAVVVVEAPPRSGALNTARHARDLGIPVLAAPHGGGALALLRRGAGLVRNADELLRVLSGAGARPYRQPPDEPDQGAVLRLLPGGARLTVDQVAARLGWRPSRAAAALLRLELAGWVCSGAGGCFVCAREDRGG